MFQLPEPDIGSLPLISDLRAKLVPPGIRQCDVCCVTVQRSQTDGHPREHPDQSLVSAVFDATVAELQVRDCMEVIGVKRGG